MYSAHVHALKPVLKDTSQDSCNTSDRALSFHTFNITMFYFTVVHVLLICRIKAWTTPRVHDQTKNCRSTLPTTGNHRRSVLHHCVECASSFNSSHSRQWFKICVSHPSKEFISPQVTQSIQHIQQL